MGAIGLRLTASCVASWHILGMNVGLKILGLNVDMVKFSIAYYLD